jgi:protein-tyrosine phosphatase
MFITILMVCVGNICRSPMAEALLAARALAAGRQVKVASAGLAALVGRPADPLAQALLQERGLDLSAHRARQVDGARLSAFELVLVMEDGHRRELERRHPEARGRIRRLGHQGGFDVPDPFGGTRADFERSLELIERGLDGYEKLLWGAGAT